MEFGTVKTAVAAQFERMQKHPGTMFRADIDGDTLWQTYLAAFPAGTNPLYRERTEHDCSCCRHFIRTVGNVVAVVNGALVSVWDCAPADPAYAAVCAALRALVLSAPIVAPFVHYESHAGTDRNFEQLAGLASGGGAGAGTGASVRTWTHFYVNINSRHVKPKADIPAYVGERRAQHDVLLRSLREISDDAVSTVLDLIAQSSLYRGEEHQSTVLQFKAAKRQFDTLPDASAQDVFAWTADASGAVTRIRNTVIGSLLTDLSEGKDLEAAVKAFEVKTAPTSYKRPSALITKAMIEAAKAQLADMGLTSALDRRFARLPDITINNVLFADRATRAAITGDVFDTLAESAPAAVKNLDKVEEVPIDRFIAEILPRAASIEVLLENRHQGNLVSLIAPSDATARHLFKWPNKFSWSYVGEVADAIRERVKQAGGNVTGDLCCRLSWSNHDDLDLHMREPAGYEIFYGNRGTTSPSGGRIDVDMNAGYGTTREPVENIFYATHRRMKEGDYALFVHQYNAREKKDVGFEVEIDYLGTVHRFAYAAAVRQDEKIAVATLRYTHAHGIEIIKSLPSTQAVRTLWGAQTQSFHRCTALMLSPNHWDDRAVGNKHYFFMLADCANDGDARGFYNEFLHEDLNAHRKVFEAVAAKMKPADAAAADQLSGLGFSSTQRNSVVCRVRGSFTRTIKITF